VSHPNAQIGWKAELNLSFEASAYEHGSVSEKVTEKATNKTVLAKRSQSGPLTVQRPFYPEGDVCHLYILHPPGGVVGGDELHINIDLSKQASTLITTPGATKFYRSSNLGSSNLDNGGKLAHQIQTLKIADGCALEWFPQENIFFDQTHTHLSTRIELENSARFMGWEVNCYGRPASNELFESGKVMSRLELYRDGIPLILDKLLVVNSDAMQSSVSMNGHPCFGTFIATDVTEELLEKARLSVAEFSKQEQQQIGMTLLDDLLVVRCLGQYAEQVSTTLKAVWSILRPEVMNRPICLPRIWST